MRRRDFIKGIAGSTVAWPLAASAQRSAVPAIGFLNSGSPEGFAPYVASFRNALSSLGYADGRNLRFEYRWAHSHDDQLPALAADLVKAQVSVIAGVNSTPAVRAAKAATAAIPIVFTIGADPGEGGPSRALIGPAAMSPASAITAMLS